MKSPLTWILTTSLGRYVILMLALVVYDWFKETFPGPETEPVVAYPIEHPFYHPRAVETVT